MTTAATTAFEARKSALAVFLLNAAESEWVETATVVANYGTMFVGWLKFRSMHEAAIFDMTEGFADLPEGVTKSLYVNGTTTRVALSAQA